MKNLLERVLSHRSLAERPPVLLDIGASGSLPAQWEMLAPYSICIAFDADTRDFTVKEEENKVWKKLYSFNRLVAAEASDGIAFHLTKSPYCSSCLRPDMAALEPWAFQQLFEVEQVIKLPAVDLNTVLQQIGLDRIDWYKTDSQGTDVRIFNSLSHAAIQSILVADFEPGILNAYVGEDKLHHLMANMDERPFWISDMEVKGTQRIHHDIVQRMGYYQQRGMNALLRPSPGWCEITYMNTFENSDFTIREYLLGWVFATIKKQHGFAMRIASAGERRFNQSVFQELHAHSTARISFSPLRLAYARLRRLGARMLGRK